MLCYVILNVKLRLKRNDIDFIVLFQKKHRNKKLRNNLIYIPISVFWMCTRIMINFRSAQAFRFWVLHGGPFPIVRRLSLAWKISQLRIKYLDRSGAWPVDVGSFNTLRRTFLCLGMPMARSEIRSSSVSSMSNGGFMGSRVMLRFWVVHSPDDKFLILGASLAYS